MTDVAPGWKPICHGSGGRGLRRAGGDREQRPDAEQDHWHADLSLGRDATGLNAVREPLDLRTSRGKLHADDSTSHSNSAKWQIVAIAEPPEARHPDDP